jgi:hypothetical protein
MAQNDIATMLDQSMQAITHARKNLATQGVTDLRNAAALVDRCHTAVNRLPPEEAQRYEQRVIGLLDEVEQLTADLQTQQETVRKDMFALNQATQAQRAYRGGNGS